MTMGLLQDTYLHVCAICNVCVHLVVVVVVVIVIPATHTSLFSKHEKVTILQMVDSIFIRSEIKIHFPIVVVVVDVVGDVDHGVDGGDNEAKKTKRGHSVLSDTLCLGLLYCHNSRSCSLS